MAVASDNPRADVERKSLARLPIGRGSAACGKLSDFERAARWHNRHD